MTISGNRGSKEMRKSSFVTALLSIGLAFSLAACSPLGQSSSENDSTSAQLPTVSEEAFQNSIANMESEYSDFDELTDYYQVTLARDDVSFIYAVTVYDSGLIEPKIGVAYDADDWIFFDSWDVRSQGETYDIFTGISSADKSTDVDNGVHEFYIHDLSDQQVLLFQQFGSDQEAKFRLLGSGGTVERDFTLKERSAIRDLINVYLGFKQGLKP